MAENSGVNTLPDETENQDLDELHEDGEYLEVIDLDEALGEDEREDQDETWISDEELETDEPEEEVMRPSFNGIEGVPVVAPVRVFKEHQGSVFCLAVDSLTGSTVISGGEDDKAYIWSADSGQIKSCSSGHKDSVVQVGFSHDSVFAFSADMSGSIKVWRVANGEETWSTETSDLKWARWHTKTHILFAGTEDGTFYMWLVPHGQCKVQQVSGAITVAELFPNGKCVCVGHGEGALSVLDLKEWRIMHTVPGRRGNEGEILCAAVSTDGNLIACGNSTGSARLIQSQTGRVLY
ncbi:angio-associated migratory cell protein-like [Paramacrobiotus metropolitanus]|uniref:angio-associated migratory cell protein-like n=1 Tax=Paramacrobiotus metropolitanus TaxID=2943436 RepID=UPI00244618AC|nr:angio-associated migratory cell protein-like [Paramacrobiotus metropolitanus]